jgi:hypothetical protein
MTDRMPAQTKRQYQYRTQCRQEGLKAHVPPRQRRRTAQDYARADQPITADADHPGYWRLQTTLFAPALMTHTS